MRIGISISKAAIGDFDPSHHNHFKLGAGEFQNLEKVMLERTWSGIQWKDCYRTKANFLQASIIALDFDSGAWSLKDAQDFCNDYSLIHIIGTTKSHQIDKITKAGTVQPACDRFRLIMSTEQVCTNLHDYEFTMQEFMQKMPCDKSCKDGGRYFFPCKEIVSSLFKGSMFCWQQKPEIKRQAERRKRELESLETKLHREKGTVPFRIKKLITEGPGPNGSRHQACYIVGAELAKIGYREQEIVSCILQSQGTLKEIGEPDVQRAVRNGAEKAVQESYG
jgi:hypothetical protein